MHYNLKKEIISAIEAIDLQQILFITDKLLAKIKNGGKIIVCGNGGSLTDGAHFVGELIGRYNKSDSKSLPAILLTTGDASGSAIANDYGYEFVFSRQIEGLGNNKDFLICISTSGKSPNIVNAINKGIEKEIDTLFLTSTRYTGEIKNKYLTIMKIYSEYTPAIQQAQMYVMHQICEFLEESR